MYGFIHFDLHFLLLLCNVESEFLKITREKRINKIVKKARKKKKE